MQNKLACCMNVIHQGWNCEQIEFVIDNRKNCMKLYLDMRELVLWSGIIRSVIMDETLKRVELLEIKWFSSF